MRFFIFIGLLITPLHAIGAECTSYERAVFSLASEAQVFQKTTRFQEYGWSRNGPSNDWLNRFQQLRDDEKDRAFFNRHGFTIADVYLIADEYRTSGSLDSYFLEVEKNILSAEPCAQN